MICQVAAREVSKSSTFLAQSAARGVTMCKPLSSTWETFPPPQEKFPFLSLLLPQFWILFHSKGSHTHPFPCSQHCTVFLQDQECQPEIMGIYEFVNVLWISDILKPSIIERSMILFINLKFNFFCNHLVVTWIINSSMSRQKSLSHEGTFVSNLNQLTLSSLCYIITWNVKI